MTDAPLSAMRKAHLMADIETLNDAITHEFEQSVDASNMWLAYRTSCAARVENSGNQREWIRLADPLTGTAQLSEVSGQELVSY